MPRTNTKESIILEQTSNLLQILRLIDHSNSRQIGKMAKRALIPNILKTRMDQTILLEKKC